MDSPSLPPQDFAQARRNMVDGQLRTFDVTDRAVLAAMEDVPRERFVPAGSVALAYSDLPLAITPRSEGRAMLPPMVLGRLIQALGIEAGMRVLDVASGPGYASAILARLGATVVALETEDDAEVAAGAEVALEAAGLGSAVTHRLGKLDAGSPGDGPFDAVLVNGAVEIVPLALLDQLGPSGRLACLWRENGRCSATVYVRSGAGFGSRRLFDAGAPLLDAFRAPAAFRF